MVHITEMRVLLPMTVEEFQKGQRYANWKTNETNTIEGQGGQLLSSAPYVSEIWGEGLFTHSLYRLGDRLPDWVTKMVPASALAIDEKTWMAYPYTRSVLTVPFFHKLKIEMISMHKNDNGSSENIAGLNEDELTIRKVDMIDIALDKVAKRDYQEKLDPQNFGSEKTGRGPLRSGWQATASPLMCAYKLVKVEANYWGVQNRVEKLMLNGVRQIVLLTHRNAFCYIDEWFDLSLQEITESEKNERVMLKAAVKQPPIVDPATGQELVVEDSAAGGDDFNSDKNANGNDDANSDDSDNDLEFFEATMEWTTQEAEEFGQSLMSGVITSGADWTLLNPSASCAICETRSKPSSFADILCQTCNEVFCQKCFSEFHVTPRLREHVKQDIMTSSAGELKRPFMPAESTANLGRKEDGHHDSNSLAETSTSSVKKEVSGTRESSGQSERSQIFGNLDKNLALRREVFRLEEISSSNEGTNFSSGPPLVSAKSKSWKVLNEILDDIQDVASTTADKPIVSQTSLASRKKLNVGPNELSEEMVRSVTALYYEHAEAVPPAPPQSSALENIAEKRPSPPAETQETDQQLQTSSVENATDPYGIQTYVDVGVYSQCVASGAIVNVELLKESKEYKRFRAMVELLQDVDPRELGHEQRLAFWINIYNALMMHAYLERGVPRNHYKRVGIMQKSAYMIGGNVFTALAVEHAILRACTYRPALASLLPIQKYKKNDHRLACALERSEPLVTFALCCGSYSSPVVRIYTVAGVKSELELACREFLAASVGFTLHFRVVVPKIMHWYARDFSSDARSLLVWISLQLPDEKRVSVEECLEKRRKKDRLSVVPYDWSFREPSWNTAPDVDVNKVMVWMGGFIIIAGLSLS